MKIHEYNEMMAHLTRPATNRNIGGGTIQGQEDKSLFNLTMIYLEKNYQIKFQKKNMEKFLVNQRGVN